MSTLAQLDDRLKRIEQLLTKVIPILDTSTKKAGSKIGNDSGVEKIKHKRTFPEVVDDESSGRNQTRKTTMIMKKTTKTTKTTTIIPMKSLSMTTL